ncbi:hypothetical protein H1R20_g15413, partial [Candolleomyces eurysporus]
MSTADRELAVKIFKLHGSGSTGNYTTMDDIASALPANLENINFARLKITDTLEDWAVKAKEKQTDPKDGERPDLEFSTALSKKEILKFVYTSILKKYAVDDDHLEPLEMPSAAGEDGDIAHRAPKETRVSQGTDLMIFIQAGTQEEQLEVATKLVAATRPSEWPAKAIANQILAMRDILFDITNEPDYDPVEGRSDVNKRVKARKIPLPFSSQRDTAEKIKVKEEAQDVTFGLLQSLMQDEKVLPPPVPNPKPEMVFNPTHASASTANQRLSFSGAPQQIRGERSYQPQLLTVGRGPTKFRWWNIATSLPVKFDGQFTLSPNPAAGDVLSLYDVESTTAAVFYRSAEDSWVDASESFFTNDGGVQYPAPGAKRVLTWKSEDFRIPTWVLETTFKKSKQFGNAWDGKHDTFVLKGPHSRTESSTIVTRISYDQASVPHSEPGFIGTQTKSEKVPPLAELFRQGYRLIEYERSPRIFIDNDDRVVIAHLSFPNELIEAGLNEAFVEAIDGAQSQLNFCSTNTTNGDDCSRGDFRTVSTGISHRGGQTEPRNLNHTPSNALILAELGQSKAIQCIATWQNNCYKQWMPRLAEKSEESLDRLLEWKPALQRTFSDTVFASTTYNFGPNVVCDFHYDHLNWAPGICAVTSGGSYDFKKGGHMVLKEAKLVIEFPPCTTILLPSATVMHGNSPIQSGELRISMTQYTAGGVVRWVDYGFRSSKEYQANRSSSRSSSMDGGNRWAESLDLYSKYSEFSTVADPS